MQYTSSSQLSSRIWSFILCPTPRLRIPRMDFASIIYAPRFISILHGYFDAMVMNSCTSSGFRKTMFTSFIHSSPFSTCVQNFTKSLYFYVSCSCFRPLFKSGSDHFTSQCLKFLYDMYLTCIILPLLSLLFQQIPGALLSCRETYLIVKPLCYGNIRLIPV